MVKVRYLAPAVMLLVTLGAGFGLFAENVLPSIPEAHAATVSITLTGCAFLIGTCTSTGWNGTTSRPNPTITVRQGDTVSVSLQSADNVPHQFLVDVDKDGGGITSNCPAVDPCSTPFSTVTSYTFTVNFAAGTYTYYCTVHPFIMLGSFIVTSPTVGGAILPVDKLALLAPYIGFASLIVALATATMVYARRSENRKQK